MRQLAATGVCVCVIGKSATRIPPLSTEQAAPNKQHLTFDSPFSQFSDGAFTGVTAVKSLHLDNNKLKSLPKGLEFGTITNLTLSNNPWNCSCELAPLRR